MDEQTTAFEDSRRILSSVTRSSYTDGTDLMNVMAALDLFTREIGKHPEVPNVELLRLLDCGGVIAEFAARCLYLRTGRDDLGWRPAGMNGLPFITDKANWISYLGQTTESADDPRV